MHSGACGPARWLPEKAQGLGHSHGNLGWTSRLCHRELVVTSTCNYTVFVFMIRIWPAVLRGLRCHLGAGTRAPARLTLTKASPRTALAPAALFVAVFAP